MKEPERMQFFFEIFDSSLSRLGPGTDASTLKALRILLSVSPRRQAGMDHAWPRVLDLGCGTGAQTLVLARHLDGTILAVDNHQPFLDALRRRAETEGLLGKIATELEDMRTLGLGESSFDLIWSEGALYCMGFHEGLAKCRSWLVPDGLMAVTELCWLKPDPPLECRRFLESQGAVVADIDTNLQAIKAGGYTVVSHFILPESAWTHEYYGPLEDRLRLLRRQYAGDAKRMEMIESIQVEIENYRQYSAYYGYVFYLMQR